MSLSDASGKEISINGLRFFDSKYPARVLSIGELGTLKRNLTIITWVELIPT
jgi:hypothetical protein